MSGTCPAKGRSENLLHEVGGQKPEHHDDHAPHHGELARADGFDRCAQFKVTLSFGVRFARNSIRRNQLADDVSAMVAMPVSVVVPTFREAGNLAALAKRIAATLRHGPGWEPPSALERF